LLWSSPRGRGGAEKNGGSKCKRAYPKKGMRTHKQKPFRDRRPPREAATSEAMKVIREPDRMDTEAMMISISGFGR